mgnify:CR=1 FL=1
MLDDFAVFILSHGRPDNVITYKTLQRAGYTGRVFIVIDNEDKTAEQYYKNFGDKVIMFDKVAEAEKTDCGDNFTERNTVLFARNAVFDIAEGMGIEYFLVLDDDYTAFDYRFDDKHKAVISPIKNIDNVFHALVGYYKNTNLLSLALLQGGDMIGGKSGGYSKTIRTYRKAMNTFFCSTLRRFNYIGRMNDDVNTYIKLGNRGNIFLSVNNATITQQATQHNKGGLTEMYLDNGTYIKSFYTVMYQPSSVKVGMMGETHKRLHHRIDWDCTVPCIISEEWKK